MANQTKTWRIYSIENPSVFDEVSGDLFLSDEGVLTFSKNSHLIAIYPRGMWTKALVLKPHEEVEK